MIEIGEIKATYGTRVDLLMEGGRMLRNVQVASQITPKRLSVGAKAVVLIEPRIVVLGLIDHSATPNSVHVSYTGLGDILVDGVLDIGLPGIIKCMASGFEMGTGFWLSYNQGTPQMFVGDSDGQYFSWDGATFKFVGNVETSGGPVITPTGLVSPQANLLRNADFEDRYYNHMAPLDWILSGQSVILEDIVT